MVFVKIDLRQIKWYMAFVQTGLRQVKCYIVFVKTGLRQVTYYTAFVKTDLRQVKCYMVFVETNLFLSPLGCSCDFCNRLQAQVSATGRRCSISHVLDRLGPPTLPGV